jgi:hypothetical protein
MAMTAFDELADKAIRWIESRDCGPLDESHIVELNSARAKRWQKDGSLVVEIETIDDGGCGGATITANRTVVLGFDIPPKRKSSNRRSSSPSKKSSLVL